MRWPQTFDIAPTQQSPLTSFIEQEWYQSRTFYKQDQRIG